jgi:hypothetical protein
MAPVQSDTQQAPLMAARPASPEMFPGARDCRRSMLRAMTHVLNPIIRALAGRWGPPLFVVARHRGRKSARLFMTPVAARMMAGGFVIPLTFGEGADWFQNLRAANSGVIQWNGVGHPIAAPQLVDWTTGSQVFRPLERSLMRLLGVRQFVQVRHAASAAESSDG